MARNRPLPALVKPNLLDRLITYVDPARGQQRAEARTLITLSGGYAGARANSRALKGWDARTGSADSDSIGDLSTLRKFSRDLCRNNPLALGAIETNVRNIVGTGLRPRPQPDHEFLGISPEDAQAWARQALRFYWLWAGTSACDVEARQDISGMQALALNSTLQSGDLFVVRRAVRRPGDLFSLKLQVVEADRVDTPMEKQANTRIRAGVESDENGAPVRYHVAQQHPGETTMLAAAQDYVVVPAFDPDGSRRTLHLYRRMRPGQTRGIPYLAPVVTSLRQLGEYSQAEIFAALIGGMMTAFVTTTGGEGLGSTFEGDSDEAAEEAAAKGEISFGHGTIVDLAPGEDVKVATPGRPNAAFDPFVQAILRQVGVALQIPFELLVMHFTASYSASRAALLEAWKHFRSQREWLAWEFCQPSYEWLITEAVALGYIKAPGFFDSPLIRAAWLNCTWIGDAQGQLDPLKEIAAAEKRITIGVSTLEEETAQLTGGEWEAKHIQRVREQRMRVEGGLAVEPVAERFVTDVPASKKDEDE